MSERLKIKKIFARRKPARLLVALCLLFYQVSAVAQQETGAWQQLAKGNAVALIRHALAPGTGDPSNFNVNDCSTQRNLSEEGRQQSARIGKLFAQNGITTAQLFSSQWCRCMETARLMDIGKVQELPAINSFFADYTTAAQQTADLRNHLIDYFASESRQPRIYVSHQVNITGLTDVFPRSGEIVFVAIEGGTVSVVDRVTTN